MDNQTTEPKRELHSYTMDLIPDGLYMDHITGECFVSTRRLAALVEEYESTVKDLINTEASLRNAVEVAEVQTPIGIRTVRIHPESTIRVVVKEYKPDLYEDLRWLDLDELLEELAKSAADSTEESANEESQHQWTLYEWMIGHCEIVLSGKLFNQFKSKVHKTYKETYKRDPERSYRNQANNPKQVSRLQVYVPAEFPVLQLCYMQTLMEVRCK